MDDEKKIEVKEIHLSKLDNGYTLTLEYSTQKRSYNYKSVIAKDWEEVRVFINGWLDEAAV